MEKRHYAKLIEEVHYKMYFYYVKMGSTTISFDTDREGALLYMIRYNNPELR